MLLGRVPHLKPLPWHRFAATGFVRKLWDILRRSKKLFWNTGESCPLRMGNNMPQKCLSDGGITVVCHFSGYIY